MASQTSVTADRKPYQAIEAYDDKVFLTDDKPLYFGNNGQLWLEYDGTNGYLKMIGLSDADPGVSDALFYFSDTGGNLGDNLCLCISAG